MSTGAVPQFEVPPIGMIVVVDVVVVTVDTIVGIIDVVLVDIEFDSTKSTLTFTDEFVRFILYFYCLPYRQWYRISIYI